MEKARSLQLFLTKTEKKKRKKRDWRRGKKPFAISVSIASRIQILIESSRSVSKRRSRGWVKRMWKTRVRVR